LNLQHTDYQSGALPLS